MKILNEAKEKLPVSFLTDFVSRGWDDVGYLKETIAAIKDVYTGTKEVEEWLNALIDAYLVCIGQMEAHLHDKKYIEFPEESKLNEAVNINVTEKDVTISNEFGEVQAKVPVASTADDTPVEEKPTEVQAEVEEPVEIKKELPDTEFDFFVDFDEPTKETGEKLTDQEIEMLQKGM